MPVENGRCWYPSSTVAGMAASSDIKLFRLCQTGEIFESYEEYIKRYKLLRSKNGSSGQDSYDKEWQGDLDKEASTMYFKTGMDIRT